MKIPDVRETIGFMLIGSSTASWLAGIASQAKLLDAFSQNKETGQQVYEQLIDKWGKIPVDLAVSYGEDLGVVLFAYGISSLYEDSPYAELIKINLLTLGVIREIAQFLGNETTRNSTFSPIDLAIFAVPLTFEIAKSIKSRHK